jgi:class 3 adenylate cyclase/predicted ATPase
MLKHVYGVDDGLLAEIRDELLLRHLASAEGEKVLIWTGEPLLMAAPVAPSPGQPTMAELPLDDWPDEPVVVPAPTGKVPEAERRQLTVMFCDLVGSTDLSGTLDPEDLREVVRAYQETAAEVIQRLDGYIAQHLGDGLLIYFGWPRAHEDDAQRALHSGLGIVQAITTTLNPRLKQEKGVELRVRLGIHTGPVVVGEMGGGGRQESLATGETVNIAARLEGLAAPNTVLLSHVTARLAWEAFVLEDMGPQVLKGVAEPMEAFRVLRPLDTERDAEESMPDGGVFLVGREEEIGILLRRWQQSKAGLGQVVLISGEAGIGKSSVVSTVRNHVLAEGYTRMTLRCSPYHTHSALYPVITHLESMLGFDRDDTPGSKLDKLAQALRMLSLPLEEAVPLLATLLSVPLQERYPMPTLSPQQQRQQTLDTLVAWLTGAAEKQPVLVVWEDLHWGDPSTLEMLGLVLAQSPTVSMLNVLTFRPEFSPPWPSRSHLTPITLNRLERPQVEALITHLMSGKALPEEVVQHIVAKTDGVPLYVEELTKMLLASELLREEAGHYVLTRPLRGVAIPDTLQDSLMARLDQMHTAKEVAQLGAVLGREFSYELLQAVSAQTEETLQAGLARLVEAELLYQRGRPPRARYLFKHALIQDAAYASLLKSTRQRVHQRIANVVEARFPEVAETQPALLAHHYTEAGCAAQAVRYWQRAGQQALQHSANLEATQHLTTGLTLLATLPETPAQVQQELDLQLALAGALGATKGVGSPEVEQTYVRARALCAQVGETSQLLPTLWGLWRFYRVRGVLPTARELGEQLFGLAQQAVDPTYRLAAHAALGETFFYLGDYAAARTHLEQGIALIDPETQPAQALRFGVAPGVACRTAVAKTLWCLGYPAQALRRSQEALALAQKIAHPLSLCVARVWGALLHLRRHEVSAVLAHAEALLSLATAQGFPLYVGLGTCCRGWGLAVQGQGAAGLAQLHQGLADVVATGQMLARPRWLTLLADAAGYAGHVDEGLRVLVEALQAFEASGQGHMLAETYRLQGILLLRQTVPAITQAEACFHQALAIARQQQARSWELRAATSLARLWQSQGKRQDAYDLLVPVYGWFTEGFDTADVQEAKGLLDELSEGR